jgi:hypothetical protein
MTVVSRDRPGVCPWSGRSRLELRSRLGRGTQRGDEPADGLAARVPDTALEILNRPGGDAGAFGERRLGEAGGQTEAP